MTTDNTESKTLRRLREAVSDLPPIYSSKPPGAPRTVRTTREYLARDVQALRARLDRLVHLEDKHGDQQTGVQFNRSERNALVRVLTMLAPIALEEAEALALAPPRQESHDPAYIAEREERIQQAIRDGYTLTSPDQPCVLRNGSGPDMGVPLSVWLAIRYYRLGLEGGTS